MRIFVYDDVRNVSCIKRMFVAQCRDAQITLVRPFRHNGDVIIADHMNALDVLENNPPFNMWILDNDLAEGLEGFQFLKEILETHPHLAPETVLSCSANGERRKSIESYFADWKRCQ